MVDYEREDMRVMDQYLSKTRGSHKWPSSVCSSQVYLDD